MKASHRILIIDDSPLVVAAVREALEDEGIAVEGTSELSAIDGARLDGFDLILVDVQMPEMFGDDVAMVMRHRGQAAATPIVLLSSLAEPALAARARDAGADGYISKQRGIDAVADDIRGWLARGNKEDV